MFEAPPRAARRRRSTPLAPIIGLAALGVAGASTTWIALTIPRGGTALGRLVPWRAIGERAELHALDATSAERRREATRRSGRGLLPGADAVVGGRDLEWWSAELARVGRSSDPESKRRAALLVARAAANGLTIDPSTGKLREDEGLARLVDATQRAEDLDEAETSTAGAPWSPPLDALVDALATAAEQDVEARRSPGHPRVILAPRPTADAALVIRFSAGAVDDGALAGLTHFAQHALLAASAWEPWQRLAMDLDRVGATLSVTTGATESSIVLEAPAPELDALAERVLRMSLTPRVATDALPVARARAIGVPSGATDALVSVLAAAAVPQPGFSSDPLGRADTIREIEPAELQAHLQGPMAPANATVVVAGRFDRRRVEALLARARSAPIEQALGGDTARPGVHEVDAALDVHLLAYPVPLGTAERAAVAHLAAAVIEERLVRRMRGAGLAYEIDTELVQRPWLDFLLVVAPFGSSPGRDVASWITGEIGALGRAPLTGRELERNQRHVLWELQRLNTRPAELARALAEGAGAPWIGPDVVRELGRITPERFHAAVAPWVGPSKTVHVILAPPASRAQRPRGRW